MARRRRTGRRSLTDVGRPHAPQLRVPAVGGDEFVVAAVLDDRPASRTSTVVGFVGITTTLIGAPYFVYLLWRSRA